MQVDPDQTWEDYYLSVRERRISEASQLWERMQQDGVVSTTFLIFDFRCFSNDKHGIENLEKQLSENYAVKVLPSDKDGYWLLDGTTRPDGIDGVDNALLVDWVTFMCDVAQSHGSVFSTWRMTNERKSLCWSNDSL